MPDVEVVNVVGTVTYRQELDLQALADTFSKRDEIESVEYHPTDNHWLQSRFQPDSAYVAFYRSGRCSVAGANSIEQFNQIEQRVTKVMHDLLQFDYTPDTEVNNIVATAKLDLSLSLELLVVHLGMESVEYEPEQFPALLFRGTDHTILLFSSGKVVCVGLTTREDVANAIKEFESQIQTVQ